MHGAEIWLALQVIDGEHWCAVREMRLYKWESVLLYENDLCKKSYWPKDQPQLAAAMQVVMLERANNVSPCQNISHTLSVNVKRLGNIFFAHIFGFKPKNSCSNLCLCIFFFETFFIC